MLIVLLHRHIFTCNIIEGKKNSKNVFIAFNGTPKIRKKGIFIILENLHREIPSFGLCNLFCKNSSALTVLSYTYIYLPRNPKNRPMLPKEITFSRHFNPTLIFTDHLWLVNYFITPSLGTPRDFFYLLSLYWQLCITNLVFLTIYS